MNADTTNRRQRGDKSAVLRPKQSRELDSSAELALSAYWLTHCEGFLVDGPEGAIGIVDGVRLDAQSGIADTLLVAVGGPVHSTIHEVPVAAVAEILPGERRLVLREPLEPAPRPREAGLARLGRWIGRIRPT